MRDGRRAVLIAAGAVAVMRILVGAWLGLRGHIFADEGSYFSSAAMLARGHLPYRDAAASHPPLTFVAFAPLTWIGPPTVALAACRIFSGVVGGVTAWLVGDTVRRRTSTGAALAAIAVYALLPEVAQAERSVLTEVFLNLLTAAAARAWLVGELDGQLDGAAPTGERRAGVFWGLAALTKLFAAFMAPAFLVTGLMVTSGRRLRRLGRLGLAAGATFVVGLAPFLIFAAGPFYRQVIVFQLTRARDGSSLAERAAQIIGVGDVSLAARALPASAVVVAGIVVWAVWRRRDTMLVFGLVWHVSLVVALLVGPYYYVRYNAHFGPAVALVAGAVAHQALGLWQRIPLRARIGAAAVAATMAIVVAINVGPALHEEQPDWTPAVAQIVRRTDGCIWSFDPAWLVAGDRLPDADRFGPVVTEPFGWFFGVSIAAGYGPSHQNPAVWRAANHALSQCPRVLAMSLGPEQLGPYWPHFRATHRRAATTVPGGPELWVRTRERVVTPCARRCRCLR